MNGPARVRTGEVRRYLNEISVRMEANDACAGNRSGDVEYI